MRGRYNNPKELFSILSQVTFVLGRENFISGPKTILTNECDMTGKTSCTRAGSKGDYFSIYSRMNNQ